LQGIPAKAGSGNPQLQDLGASIEKRSTGLRMTLPETAPSAIRSVVAEC
jgi:hypothetical protein